VLDAGRILFVLVKYGVLLAGMGVTGIAAAGDGDVDYSAPYITVDPETGQLVTRNPGPKLKMHEQMAPAAAIESSPAVASAVPVETASPSNSETPSASQSILAIVATLSILVAGFAVWRSRQKQTTSS
jgi:hypothetical protein